MNSRCRQLLVLIGFAVLIEGVFLSNFESHASKDKLTVVDKKTMEASPAEVQDALLIAITDNFQPFTFVNAEGEPAGLFVDIWKIWSAKTGQKIEFQATTWRESLENLKNGSADVHRGLSITPERKQWLIFSQPFYENSFYLFFRNTAKITLKKYHIKTVRLITEQTNLLLIQCNFYILTKKGNYTVRTSKIFEPTKTMNCI